MSTSRKVRRFMRRRDVEAATGLKHTTIYRMVGEGTFPRPFKLTDKAVAWDEEEVAAWQAERLADRAKAAAGAHPQLATLGRALGARANEEACQAKNWREPACANLRTLSRRA